MYPTLSTSWAENASKISETPKQYYNPVYPYNTADATPTSGSTEPSSDSLPDSDTPSIQSSGGSPSKDLQQEIPTTHKPTRPAKHEVLSLGGKKSEQSNSTSHSDSIPSSIIDIPPPPPPDADTPNCTVIHPILNAQIATPAMSPAYAEAMARAAAEQQLATTA